MENSIEVSLMEECIICYDETEEFTFFSCGHKACATCFPKLHQCPFCQPDTKIQIRQIQIRPVELHHQPREDYCKLCCSILIIMMFCVWCLHIVGLF